VCRPFGLSGAPERIRATFWLLEAPDSLVEQSRRKPDGTGLGTFEPDCTPRVEKSPIAVYQDEQFAQEAKRRTSITFNAHVRYASTGARSQQDTHPFEQHGRMFAHNGSSVTCRNWRRNWVPTATWCVVRPTRSGSSP
jgi:predicted glutamine amidotransferase